MKKFTEFYGIATLGARGQIVIPSKARKMLRVKSGDTLVVTSRPRGTKKMINLIPSKDFSVFLHEFEKHIVSMKSKISPEDKK